MKHIMYFIFLLLLCLQTKTTFAVTQSNCSQISQKSILSISSHKQSFIKKNWVKKIEKVKTIVYKIIEKEGKFWEKLSHIGLQLLICIIIFACTFVFSVPFLLLGLDIKTSLSIGFLILVLSIGWILFNNAKKI